MAKSLAPLLTSRFSQGPRTFFFDVKRTANGRPFIRITVSAVKGEDKRRDSMTVFDSEVQEFCQAVADASSFILNR